MHCPQCGLTYYANVASAVACVIIDRSGCLLSVRRALDPARGTLDLPGGFVDPLETVEEAVARELKEETGLEALSMRYLMSLPNVYPYSGITVYTSDLFFLVEVENLEDAVAQDDAAEIVILPLAECRAEDYGLPSIRAAMSRFIAQPELLHSCDNHQHR